MMLKRYLEAACVAFNLYMGPFCSSLDMQVTEKLPFCYFIPAPPRSPSLTPAVFAQSKCISRVAVTPVGVGCLSRAVPHISMTWPPLSPGGETFI